MSSTTKWVLVILVIIAIVLGLWWGGILGGKPASTDQSAAALTAAVDVSDTTIASESAAIDAQLKVAGNQFAAFSQAPSVSAADLLAGQLGGTAALMNKLSSRLQTRVSSLKSVGVNTNVLQAAVSDLGLQTNYAVEETGLSGQAIASVKPDNGDKVQVSKNMVGLQQAAAELQKSLIYLQAAQKDIKTVIDGFKTSTAR